MVGLWRIEERNPEQHYQQHSDRPEQVGEGASHGENIRLDGITSRRWLNLWHPKLLKPLSCQFVILKARLYCRFPLFPAPEYCDLHGFPLPRVGKYTSDDALLGLHVIPNFANN